MTGRRVFARPGFRTRIEGAMSPTLLTDRDGRVADLTLNRPEALNALSSELVRALVQAVQDCDADDGVGAIILTGQGKRAFTAGMDLKEAAGANGNFLDGPQDDPALAIMACRTPIIVAVNGLCITGGMEIMLNCDIVYAARTARFADTHVRVGLLPGWGISQRLARQIGPQRAKELSLSGTFIDAERALEIGLVNRVFEPADLLPEALALAHAIADNDDRAVQGYKQVIDDGYALPLRDALVLERERGAAYARSLAPGELDSGRRRAQDRNRAQLSS
jgi:enoyl-CoA hydratase